MTQSNEEIPNPKDALHQFLKLSDRSFDPIAKDKLRNLLETERTDEEMRVGVKELLDMCVHGSLCSDFEILVLDFIWKEYGGEGPAQNPSKNLKPERSLTTDEIFDLTTKYLGHCNDEEQLLYIIRYAEARIAALKNRTEKNKSLHTRGTTGA